MFFLLFIPPPPKVPVVYTNVLRFNTNGCFGHHCINHVLVITVRAEFILFLIITISPDEYPQFIKAMSIIYSRHVFAEDLFTFLACKHHFVGLSKVVVWYSCVAFSAIKPLFTAWSTNSDLLRWTIINTCFISTWITAYLSVENMFTHGEWRV